MGHFSKLLNRATLAVGIFLTSAVTAMADPIATVLAVEGNARGPQGVIEVGDRIDDGLIIRTNARTQLELRFDDGTLMAIGPNSELEVSSVLMNSGGTANRFAINATVGSFRFLSGDSNRDAYEITTPASTIGIRGTEFDIFVRGQVTAVTLYNGALEMCLANGTNCWAFRGSCYVAEANQGRGTVRGLRPNEARGYLSNFIYSRGQRSLSPALQTKITSCNKYFIENDDPVVETETEAAAEEDTTENGNEVAGANDENTTDAANDDAAGETQEPATDNTQEEGATDATEDGGNDTPDQGTTDAAEDGGNDTPDQGTTGAAQNGPSDSEGEDGLEGDLVLGPVDGIT